MDPAVEQRLRSAYAAFVAGDVDAAVAGIHPDAELVNPPDAIETGTRHGREELRATFRRLHDEFEFESLDVLEMFEGPSGVVVVSHWVGRGRRSGAPLEAMLTHVFELNDGLVVTYRWFRSIAEGRAAAGL
ncbi:MAG: nuclear transport factor 2 family protein [Thermoleophilaceae bacterium]|nr:nuclear transport factor 2 family protein [Thermoleophilaceae bacterium]